MMNWQPWIYGLLLALILWAIGGYLIISFM